MSFDNYKFILKTCASSENEVTGEDIDLEDSFVSMSIMPWDSDLNPVIHTREELEDLVDQIDFSLL